jgi:hypothetical protein
MYKEELLEQEIAVANCISCTLADAMKDCHRCQFNSGLPVRTVYLKSIELRDKEPALSNYWKTLPAVVWNAYCDYGAKTLKYLKSAVTALNVTGDLK